MQVASWRRACGGGPPGDRPRRPDASRSYTGVPWTPGCSLPEAAGACCGSAYLCDSHDEIVDGTKPTRPYRMNWMTPDSGPREPYINSVAMNPTAPTISIR